MSGGTRKSRPCNGIVASSLTIVRFVLQSPAKPVPDCATYQTNLNHPRYSKCTPLRLTLSMLWFLRVPPMVRTAFIVLSLAVFVATSADAARNDTVRTPAHATITKSTIHKAHSPSRPASRSKLSAKKSPPMPQRGGLRALLLTVVSVPHLPPAIAPHPRQAVRQPCDAAVITDITLKDTL